VQVPLLDEIFQDGQWKLVKSEEVEDALDIYETSREQQNGFQSRRRLEKQRADSKADDGAHPPQGEPAGGQSTTGPCLAGKINGKKSHQKQRGANTDGEAAVESRGDGCAKVGNEGSLAIPGIKVHKPIRGDKGNEIVESSRKSDAHVQRMEDLAVDGNEEKIASDEEEDNAQELYEEDEGAQEQHHDSYHLKIGIQPTWDDKGGVPLLSILSYGKVATSQSKNLHRDIEASKPAKVGLESVNISMSGANSGWQLVCGDGNGSGVTTSAAQEIGRVESTTEANTQAVAGIRAGDSQLEAYRRSYEDFLRLALVCNSDFVFPAFDKCFTVQATGSGDE
jgi:hypothetical protein